MKDNTFLRIPKGKDVIIERYKEALHLKLRKKKKQKIKECLLRNK